MQSFSATLALSHTSMSAWHRSLALYIKHDNFTSCMTSLLFYEKHGTMFIQETHGGNYDSHGTITNRIRDARIRGARLGGCKVNRPAMAQGEKTSWLSVRRSRLAYPQGRVPELEGEQPKHLGVIPQKRLRPPKAAIFNGGP